MEFKLREVLEFCEGFCASEGTEVKHVTVWQANKGKFVNWVKSSFIGKSNDVTDLPLKEVNDVAAMPLKDVNEIAAMPLKDVNDVTAMPLKDVKEMFAK